MYLSLQSSGQNNSWLWAPVAINQKHQACMSYLSCTLPPSSNLFMNKTDLQAKRVDDESNRNSISQEISSKSPVCLVLYKRGSSPGLVLLLQHTTYVGLFITTDFCYKKKGGQWWWESLCAYILEQQGLRSCAGADFSPSTKLFKNINTFFK